MCAHKIITSLLELTSTEVLLCVGRTFVVAHTVFGLVVNIPVNYMKYTSMLIIMQSCM